MVILYSFLIAVLIVSGQALWKSATVDSEGKITTIFSTEFLFHFLFSPKMLFGVLIYGIATLLYIYLLSKFNYFQVQSIVVGSSLVLTVTIALIFFGERPSMVNFLGIFLILLGSFFVISR